MRFAGKPLSGTLLVLLLFLAGNAQADADWRQRWSSFWRNADQRGEQLLRQGDAAAAARTYADPRRRAFAELQAGDYSAAARDFSRFDDADAHYNRGNALARGGDLAAALKAYDTALARDPKHRDARHNRDLVARAMQQQPTQQQPTQQPPAQQPPAQQQGGGGSGQTKPESNAKAKAGQDSGRGDGSGEKQDQVGKQDPSRHTDQPDKQGRSGKPGQTGRPENSGSRAERPADGKADATPQSQAAGIQQRTGGDEAEQARRDAEAGMAPATADTQMPGRNGAPRGEQQLAREQWLRQIPDDPGGLLRRKFMIEHLMRQQGDQR